MDIGKIYRTYASLPFLKPVAEEMDAKALFFYKTDGASEQVCKLKIKEEWKYSEITKKSRERTEYIKLRFVRN